MQRALPYLLPLVSFGLLLSFIMPQFANAQGAAATPGSSPGKTLIQGSLDKAAAGSFEGSETDISKIIGNLINIVLGLVGLLFLITIIYAGVLYMTARGDDAQVKKAKSMLTNSVIGIVIVMGAYVIVAFVVGEVGSAL